MVKLAVIRQTVSMTMTQMIQGRPPKLLSVKRRELGRESLVPLPRSSYETQDFVLQRVTPMEMFATKCAQRRLSREYYPSGGVDPM